VHLVGLSYVLSVLLYVYTVCSNLERIKPSEGKSGLCNIAWLYLVPVGEIVRILFSCLGLRPLAC
jgi:hypothetical protein